MANVYLKKGRERSLRRRHPWVYSGAIDRVAGDPTAGDVVRVHDHAGNCAGWGYFNPRSKIQVRVLDWNEQAVIDESWWRARLSRAVEMRRTMRSVVGATAQRLVYAEADGLPGLIVDRYGDYLVVQCLTAGVERHKPQLFRLLADVAPARGVFERSDSDARALEGLDPHSGVVVGAEPPALIEVSEGAGHFVVDVRRGHKTGFYIDQGENRRRVARFAQDARVLDLFCYSGSFGIHALRAGAKSVRFVDSSQLALEHVRQHLELNNLEIERAEIIEENAFELMRSYRDRGEKFDLVIVDPPKFAPSRAMRAKAERAYKDVNLQALRLVEPGGVLATFSCSGAVGPEAFARIVAWAQIDSGREVQVLHRLSQAPDHPISPTFPESEYLTGLICRVL